MPDPRIPDEAIYRVIERTQALIDVLPAGISPEGAQAITDNAFYQYDEYILPTPSRGHFDVWEAFGELNAPILKDVPFASLLSVGAAGRYSDYSTVGSTRAYQFNGIYAPIREISFRGSYGR
jgi:hypothetical protein